jgi:multidrug efflux pump subunit AcrA (membrane-fusion protein)
MIVEADLFDVDDGAVMPGMEVTAVVDAFPDVSLRGEIVEVDDIANETSQRSLRRVFRTRVRLEELDLDRMRPGMSVKVVVRDHRDEVLLVPRMALGWVEEGTGGGVVAVLADGEVRRVAIGSCNVEFCVVEDGLSEGERLGTHGREVAPEYYGEAR